MTEDFNLDSIEASAYAKILVAYPTGMDERCEELLSHGVLADQIVPVLQSVEPALSEASPRESAE